MGYIVAWDNDPQTRILIQFDAPLTWEIVHTAYEEGYALMRSMDYPVDWITDISATDIPRDHIFSHLRYLHGRVPRNARFNAVILPGMSSFTRTILETFVNAIAWTRGFGVAATLDEGRAMIERSRIPQP